MDTSPIRISPTQAFDELLGGRRIDLLRQVLVGREQLRVWNSQVWNFKCQVGWFLL